MAHSFRKSMSHCCICNQVCFHTKEGISHCSVHARADGGGGGIDPFYNLNVKEFQVGVKNMTDLRIKSEIDYVIGYLTGIANIKPELSEALELPVAMLKDIFHIEKSDNK